jgi:glycosyltransferase involved in cell wall biosynthesis
MALRRIALETGAEIVHLHTSRALTLAPYLPHAAVGIVTRRMDYPPRGLAAYVRWLYRRVDAVIAISSAVRDALVARGVPARRIHVVPSGIDPKRWQKLDRDEARGELGIAPGDPVIALVGALYPRKGHAVLLEAVALLTGRGLRPTCLFAGSGPEGDSLMARAASLGVERQARWLGRLDDVAPVLAAADLVAVPSLAEGLGVAALEAMAAGRPVVASAVGGLRETVRHEGEGLLVPPGDPAELADALARCLTDAGLRQTLGAAGRTRAERFSTLAMARGTESVYERALAARVAQETRASA